MAHQVKNEPDIKYNPYNANPNPSPTTKQYANSQLSTKYSHMSYGSREIHT